MSSAVAIQEPEHGTTEWCGPICDDLIAVNRKHHSVIVAHVHGAVDSGEGTEPMSRAEAWSTKYKGKGNAAKSAYSRMLTDVDSALACQEFHEAQADQEVVAWGDGFKRRERLRAMATPASISRLGKPDPVGRDEFFDLLLKGVPNESSTEDTDIEYHPRLTVTYHAGFSAPTDRQLGKPLGRWLLAFEILPTEEWPRWALETCAGWQETKSNKMIPVFNIDQAAARIIKTEGLAPELLHVTHPHNDNLRQVFEDYLAGAIRYNETTPCEHCGQLASDPEGKANQMVLEAVVEDE